MGETRKTRPRMRAATSADQPKKTGDAAALATLAVIRQEFGAAPGTGDLARYIADMSAELASLAGSSKLDLLAYFLNMAQVEAEAVARKLAYEEQGAR